MSLFNSILVSLFLMTCVRPISQNQIIGKWKMVIVLENNIDQTEKHNPENDRWISFNPDNSFKSDGSPYGENTGTYFLNEKEGTLFIDSDTGEDDDSLWKITFRNDTLIMNGVGSPRQEGTYIYSVKK